MMFKLFSALLTASIIAGCSQSTPSPVIPAPRHHPRRHALKVIPLPDNLVGTRVSIKLPDGWRMVTGYYTNNSAIYVAGHFAPQDGQAQIDVTEAERSTQALCDDESAYQKSSGAVIAPSALVGLPEGACAFSWQDADRKLSGTVLVAPLPTTVKPALTVQVSITGLYGNEAILATYAPLITAAVKAQ
jgi:hypothetical protein